MSWFLYVIECQDGSLYTGISTDVERRYAQHAAGKGARYTRAHPPKRLLLALEYPDQSEALKAEYAVKQLRTAQKWQWCKQQNEGF
jgi:putative endonuclease